MVGSMTARYPDILEKKQDHREKTMFRRQLDLTEAANPPSNTEDNEHSVRKEKWKTAGYVIMLGIVVFAVLMRFI